MELAAFAMWRFRNAEGVMKYIKSWNLTECVMNVKGREVKLEYDMKNETVTINTTGIFSAPVTVPFKDFVEKMKSLGFYEERPANERHTLSYGPPKD